MELKPCPFCGGKVDALYYAPNVHRDAMGNDTIRVVWKIRCGKCRTEFAEESEYFLSDEEKLLTIRDGRSKVIERWNRRTDHV